MSQLIPKGEAVLKFYAIKKALLPALIGLRLYDSASAQGDQDTSPIKVSSDFLLQNWQTDQGLPRESIFSLAQDGHGYLWMGTPQGMARFDGVRFVALEGVASLDMARGSVQRIFADNEGRLWIATRRSGLFCYSDGEISSMDSSNLPASVAIDSVAQDGAGKIWVTRGDGMVGWLQKGQFIPTAQLSKVARGPMLFGLTADTDGQLWFSSQDTYGRLVAGQPIHCTTHKGGVISLAPSPKGGLWVSTGFDLRRLKPDSEEAEQIVVKLPNGPYEVSAMHEDRQGTLWMGLENQGLFLLRNGSLEKVKGVSHTVNAIWDDIEGNLWVGTDGAGLYKVRPREFQIINQTDGLPSDAVVSVCEDWVVPRGQGVARILNSGGVEMIGRLGHNSVSAVMGDGHGGFWAGTTGGRLIHQSQNGDLQSTRLWQVVDGPQIRTLYRDDKGNLWAGGFPSGLFFFPADGKLAHQDLSWHGFSNQSVTAIAGDATGGIWIGSSAGYLFECKTNTFQRFDSSAGFNGFPITALLPAADESVWVGTLGGGMELFKNGKVQFLGDRAGVNDSVITQLIQDSCGFIWIGTSRGICRVSTSDLKAVLGGRIQSASAVQFGPSDGLLNVECVAGHQPSVWLTRSGMIRFATSKGVVSFDPTRMPVNTHPPPLVLEDVLVDDHSVSIGPGLKLPWGYNKIELRYTATSFVAPGKVHFKRRLRGFDQGWVEDGTMRRAVYPRLSPGKYLFEFTACNNNGVWNNSPCQFAFEVVPAIWQTAWFRAGGMILFAGLISMAVMGATRMRMRRKLARLEKANVLERERTRISRDLHDDLGARLTQVALLSDLAVESAVTPPGLKPQIQEVSTLVRLAVQSLDETVWMLNPQKDTLAHTIDYLAHYAEHFFQPTPIHCRLEICRQPPPFVMPGKLRRDILMLVKEALNNVLKHSQAREAWLRIAVRGPMLRITVKDDGRGFNPETPTLRNGLENMRLRGWAAGIRVMVMSQDGQGTQVTFQMLMPPFKWPAKKVSNPNPKSETGRIA